MNASVRSAVLVLAGGSGSRLGGSLPKAFAEVAGRPMLDYSLASISMASSVDVLVLVVPEGYVHQARARASLFAVGEFVVVSGGDTRAESVRRGLKALAGDIEVVLCHDAARPMATPQLFDRVLNHLKGPEEPAGVVPAVDSPDTVKLVREGWIVETVPRQQVRLAQTPQGFRRPALADAHFQAAGDPASYTDDAALLESLGHRVAVIPGEALNFKVTLPEDLARAGSALRLTPHGGVLARAGGDERSLAGGE